MKVNVLILLILVFGLYSCTKDEVTPCVWAKVIDTAPCGGGVLLKVCDAEEKNTADCFTSNNSRYVTVDNLSEELHKQDKVFSCKLIKRDEVPRCLAIYTQYEAASIRTMCSQ